MGIRINCDFKEWDENVIYDVLEGGNNPHILVHIVQPWELDKGLNSLLEEMVHTRLKY